ncbi:MAG: tetratricopeptide repeat protein [Hyphomonadaceae bacterium]|nr:tetratricopeptide repeat protein [Hyphomonadaceae bacterium]
MIASVAALASSGCVSALAQTTTATPYADFLIGSYAERARDPAAASQRFAAALRMSPRDPLLLEGAADAALISGDVATAAQLGRRADAIGLKSASGQLATAALALRAGKHKAATTQLRTFEGAPVEQLSAAIINVWALAGSRRTDEALEALRIDVSAPRSPWVALQHFERALVFDYAGRNQDALDAYARGAAAGGLRIAQVVLFHGELLERTGRTEEARALYADMLDDVDNPAVRTALARLERGEAPQRSLTPALGAAVSLFALAVLVGQDPVAQEDLTPLSLAMALAPDFEGSRLAFSDSMRALERGAAAREVLAAIPRTSPYYETAQSQIAFSLRRDGREDEAVAVLEAAVRETDGRAARRALADLYRNLERYADAAPIYEALASDIDTPSARDWRLYFAQGATLERLGRWPEAEAALQRALALSPDQPEVLNYLGYQWVDSGQKVREGLAILQRAVAQRPDEGYIVDSLGWAHFKLGQYDKAIELLERAVELSPGDVTLNDHLGDAYWRVGRKIEARYQWRRILTLAPTEAERASAERKLAGGLPPVVR